MENAVNMVNTSIDMMLPYDGSQIQKLHYQHKGVPCPITSPQFQADMLEAKKQVKNAISEVDFRNIRGCINALMKAATMCNKY